MGLCNTINWYFRSILRGFRKRKFRPFVRFLIDSRFRSDIRHIRRVLGDKKLPSRHRAIQLNRIHSSHDINYPEWVDRLVATLLAGYKLPPIKITWDGTKYIVVDGNHRLAAMRRVLKSDAFIHVVELIGLQPPIADQGDLP